MADCVHFSEAWGNCDDSGVLRRQFKIPKSAGSTENCKNKFKVCADLIKVLFVSAWLIVDS